jgi:hypothetical protein
MAIENQGATTEVEEQVTEQPQSMDDSIRETLRDIEARNSPPEVPEGTIPEEPEAAAQRIRDAQGKFAKPAVEEAAAATEAPAATAEAPTVPKELQSLGLRKEEAEAFAAAPKVLQDAFVRRADEMFKGVEQYKAAAQYAQTIEKVIAPHSSLINSYGISPDQAISEMLSSVNILRNGRPEEKMAHFAQLAQHYGIDLAAAQEHKLAPIDPHLLSLQQEVQKLSGYIRTQESSVQQQAEASLNSEITAFAADPNHSHFETVKPHMIALLQAGQAKDLPDAYEQAVYANPTTRASMLQQQVNAQREEATKKAQAAKTAASTNTSRRPSMPVSQPIGSMEDTIRAELRRLQGA